MQQARPPQTPPLLTLLVLLVASWHIAAADFAKQRHSTHDAPTSSFELQQNLIQELLREDVGFLDESNRSSGRHFEHFSKDGRHLLFQYKGNLSATTVDMLHQFPDVHTRCHKNTSRATLSGEPARIRELQDKLDISGAHVLAACSRDSDRDEKHAGPTDTPPAHFVGKVVGDMIIVRCADVSKVCELDIEVELVPVSAAFDTLKLRFFSGNASFDTFHQRLQRETGKKVTPDAIFQKHEIEALKGSTRNPRAHLVIDERIDHDDVRSRRKLLAKREASGGRKLWGKWWGSKLLESAATVISDTIDEAVDAAADAILDAAEAISNTIAGDGDPLLETTFSLGLWNFDSGTGAAAAGDVVLYENGPVTVTCVDCWVSLSSCYVYVDLDWSLLSGINNVVGGVDATIIANVDVEAAVSASKSASKSIDLVPPVCIPYICYGATIMGIGATVGATAGVSFDTSFNFDGSLSATAGFQATYKAGMTVNSDGDDVGLDTDLDMEYHEPVVELQASASLRSMVVPTVTLGAWADAAVASLSAIVFAKYEIYAELKAQYTSLQLGDPDDFVATFCQPLYMLGDCDSEAHDTRVALFVGADAKAGYELDYSLLGFDESNNDEAIIPSLTAGPFTLVSLCVCTLDEIPGACEQGLTCANSNVTNASTLTPISSQTVSTLGYYYGNTYASYSQGTTTPATTSSFTSTTTTPQTPSPTTLPFASDCTGNNASGAALWVGDGVCDDGDFGIDLNCAKFNYDGGDCAGECARSCFEGSCDEVISYFEGAYSCSDLELAGCICGGCECNWARERFGNMLDCDGVPFTTAQQAFIGDGLCDTGNRTGAFGNGYYDINGTYITTFNASGNVSANVTTSPNFACTKFDCDDGDCALCTSFPCTNDTDCNASQVCMLAQCIEYVPQLCARSSEKCGVGDGGCSSDAQCKDALVCGNNNCADYHQLFETNFIFADCCTLPEAPTNSCTTSCHGYTCDEFSVTCSELETVYGCDCSNCDCVVDDDNCTDCDGRDCRGYAHWVDDGVCDNGSLRRFNFNCAAKRCDGGDCREGCNNTTTTSLYPISTAAPPQATESTVKLAESSQMFQSTLPYTSSQRSSLFISSANGLSVSPTTINSAPTRSTSSAGATAPSTVFDTSPATTAASTSARNDDVSSDAAVSAPRSSFSTSHSDTSSQPTTAIKTRFTINAVDTSVASLRSTVRALTTPSITLQGDITESKTQTAPSSNSATALADTSTTTTSAIISAANGIHLCKLVKLALVLVGFLGCRFT